MGTLSLPNLRFLLRSQLPTLSGQPNMEKGNNPDENHVSSTSSSEMKF